MTKIKLCGLSRAEDILAANELKPDYIGFVFVPGSKRYIPPEKTVKLKAALTPGIHAAGVFVNERAETIAGLLRAGAIDIAQLHGDEDDNYIVRLRRLTDKPILKAFRITSEADTKKVNSSTADMVLLDAGAGGGEIFDWKLIKNIDRPYFLAGGLDCENILSAIRTLHPYAVDVSSGIETNGKKDKEKMAAFVAKVRKEDEK